MSVGCEDFTKGCRAPDMANGLWTEHLRRILGGQESVVLGLTVGLSPSDRALLLYDWGRAKDSLTLGLKLRFNFFACLPHRLLGLAAHSEHEAQVAAAECLRMWDSEGISGTRRVSGQHPLAARLLAEGAPLRIMVEKVSQGAAVASLSELAHVVLPWRFLSVLERSIEAKHSMAKKRSAFKQFLTS
jgi:hypothetical protein